LILFGGRSVPPLKCVTFPGQPSRLDRQGLRSQSYGGGRADLQILSGFPSFPMFLGNSSQSSTRLKSHCAMQSLLVMLVALWATFMPYSHFESHWAPYLPKSDTYEPYQPSASRTPSRPRVPHEAFNCHCQAPGTVPGDKSRTAHRERHTKTILRFSKLFSRNPIA
jgi:hypothetical protein